MSSFVKWHQEIYQFLESQPSFFTPGLRLCCYHRGQKVIDLSWGQVYTYYDLASLTKPFFILSAILRGVYEKRFELETSLARWYPELPSHVSVGDLLAHQGYLKKWLPFYQDEPPYPQTGALRKLVDRALKEAIVPDPQGPEYSDLGYWILGDWLQQVYERSLLQIWQELVVPFLGFSGFGLHFIELDSWGQPIQLRAVRADYAPTFKCPWRNQTLQAQVEDEHAWLCHGVAPHAGLFGSVEDVASWVLWLRAQWYGLGRVQLNQEFLRAFLEPRGRWKGDWVCGLMLPTPGNSSGGQRLSPNSWGHTGFTGCSFWFDWQKDWIVIILSNRTFLGRNNEVFRAVRPKLHDFVYDLVLGS